MLHLTPEVKKERNLKTCGNKSDLLSAMQLSEVMNSTKADTYSYVVTCLKRSGNDIQFFKIARNLIMCESQTVNEWSVARLPLGYIPRSIHVRYRLSNSPCLKATSCTDRMMHAFMKSLISRQRGNSENRKPSDQFDTEAMENAFQNRLKLRTMRSLPRTLPRTIYEAHKRLRHPAARHRFHVPLSTRSWSSCCINHVRSRPRKRPAAVLQAERANGIHFGAG
jgi:hypothetical protein